MFINESLNKDPYIVPEEASVIILDGKYAVYMDNNFKDTNNTRHINRRVHLVIIVENYKWQNIDWCEGALKFKTQ